MMGTRAAAFTGKISNLRESLLRIQNNTLPQPTCVDLANMLKYFCQAFHDFRDFKDIENIPLYASEKKDYPELIKTLPNFDYSGLYRTLAQLVDILPLIPQPSNGYEQLCINLLLLFKCLMPFLDQTNMETMPYLVSTLFFSYPQSMHNLVLDTLCFNLLPFTIDQQQRSSSRLVRRTARRGPGQSLTSGGVVRTRPVHQKAGVRSGQEQPPFHCIVRIENSSEPGASEQAGVRPAKAEEEEDQGIELTDEREAPLGEAAAAAAAVAPSAGWTGEDDYAMLSVTSILMVSFHYMQEPMQHLQLIECLMKLKSNVFADLLFVIAYGTTRARCPAVEILFRYWPDICPSMGDRKNNNQTSSKLKHIPWQATKCQNKSCGYTSLEEDEAVKMCMDFKLSIKLSGAPPPMLVCLDCVDSICKQLEQPGGTSVGATGVATATATGTPAEQLAEERVARGSECVRASIEVDYSNKFLDLLLPMERISKLCENKKCKSSQDRLAVGTCFDIECANYNGKRPIRYCKSCFVNIHEPCESNNYDVTLQNHIRHSSMELNIMEDDEHVNNFVEAIISLLKEAAPAEKPSKDSERHLRSLMGPMSQFSMDNKDMNTIATEEKQLISQYGIWLMTGLCKSVERLSDELLGRLLGMLFQWFHFTACLPDDQAGSALEKLKGECIKGWIMEVKTKRLDVFISCLLPHPIDCSKIGGHWEVWPDNAHQIKEGFKRLLCLVPYDIITDDVWDEIMPYWMECFRHEVPENELSELKILLSKVFDPELSPLGFETRQMYNFISTRFEDAANTNQEQTLCWLQIITMLEIPIPIRFLYQMLQTGVKSLAQIRSNELGKIKMVARLRELNKLARRKQKRASRKKAGAHEPDDECDDDQDDQDEGDESETSAMSVDQDGDDDVILANNEQQPASEEVRARKERQAQARAAFSAKLFQQASALDAQHETASRPPAAGGPMSGSLTVGAQLSTGSGPSSAGAGQLSGEQQRGQQQQARTSAPVKSQTSGDLAPLATGEPELETAGHSKPLKSTSSGRGKSEAGSSCQSAKPKLRLNVESVEDCCNLSKIDNNLVCYILMLDILLKQLDLQEISSHRGLDGKEAQEAIELLNAIISTPWLGRHTCCDSLPYTSSSSPSADQPQAPSTGSNMFLASVSQAQEAPKAAAATGGRQARESEAAAANRRDVSYSNIHSFSHCAQGFEHEDSYETCVFCEIISTFFQLAMALVEFFSPVIEVSICEVSQDAANGEFDGKPDYSRIGLNHLGPSPRDQNVEFDFQHTQASLQRLQLQQDPTSPFSPSYAGPTLKREVLESLPRELQLSYNLLVQFHQYQTPDIVSQLLQMIKLVSLHSQVLSKAAKDNAQFISWCQHNMLVNKLWSLCQLESSEIARTCVPLLLHCITLPWGVRLFRDLVERDFNSDNWLSRFRAVERVVTIAYFCEPSTIKNSTLLQSTMASAFCYVVRCLDDIEAIVAQRALVSLEMMKTSSLKLLLWCLEVQFDYITIDRSIILRSVFQLYNHLRDRRFLTWEFFLNRFDTIFLEAQIYLQQTGEIATFTMQDLKNTNTKSEIYQKKIVRAREALLETHQSRSLSQRFQEHKFAQQSGGESGADYKRSLKLQQQLQEQQAPPGHSLDTLDVAGCSWPASRADKPKKGAGSHLSPMRRVLQHGHSTSSRYQSVAFLTSQALAKRKNSKFMSNLAMQSVPPLMSLPDKLHQHLPNSFVDDGSKMNEIAQENHVFGVVHRISDEDRDTNHSLIFLLMQFFSKPDPSHPQSIKTLNRSHQIVLKHLNILMGYSIARKNFLIQASNLRLLPVFNAFLTSLPKVLDFNYSLGSILLDTCLPVLIYCPARDGIHFESMRRPSYSLWLLNPMMRQNWLMSVMTFLYKYQFNQAHLKEQVNMLIWIIINTLESHLNTTLADVVAPAAPTPATQTAPADQQRPARGHAASSTSGPEGQQPPTTAATIEEQENAKGEGLPMEVEEEQTGDASPLAGNKKRACTSLEMQKASEERATVPTSTSSGSLKHQSSELALTGARPTIMKADTMDNLISKKRTLQRQEPSACSSSATRVSSGPEAAAPVGDCGETRAIEERLLPIGPGVRQQRVGQPAARPANVERLLPIGYAPTITQVPAVVSKNTQTPPLASGALSRGPCERPLQGLSGNLNKSLIEPAAGGQSKSEGASVSGQPSAPKSPSAVISGAKKAQMARELREEEPVTPVVYSSKAARLTGGRFGVSKQSSSDARLLQGRQHEVLDQAEQSGAPPAGKSGNSSTLGTLVGGGRKGRLAGAAKYQTKDYVPKPAGAMPHSHSSPSLLNEQLAQLNRHSFVQEFADKDLSMCLVILETFIHHEPSMAAHMLPNILRLVARYSSSHFESWQTGSNAHLVGGSMFVARQFIRVALHDLMENNIFHQIFTSHFTGYEFYKSMATALADFSDLNQLAPLSKLFEDLNKQKNLPPIASLMTILENVATYFECITQDVASSHAQSTWNQFIMNWENFLRKLILALPRFSGNWTIENSARTSAAANLMPGSGRSTGAAADAVGPQAVEAAANLAAGASSTGRPTSGLAESSPSAPGTPGVATAADSGSKAPLLAGSAGASSAPSAVELTQQQQASGVSGAPGGGAVVPDKQRQNPSSCSMIMAPIMRIILATSKVAHLASCKTIVDPYSKIISYTVLNSQFKYEHLLEINHNCCRLYTRDREKYLIQRTIAYELVQVLKFRFFILEENLLLLLLFVLQDVGGTLPTKVLTDTLKLARATLNQADSYITNVSECLRQHMGELLEFVTDVHAISRINDNLVGSRPSSINRDSFGGHVKAAISQYLALEISLSHSGDQRTIARYLPWLYNSPSLQQGPREFIDCVSHIRQLSWLILGSLQHSALVRDQASRCAASAASRPLGSGGTQAHYQQAAGAGASVQCQPIPIEKNNNIAEHVQVILAGFAEQSKESVLHMSGLFHAFLLCQLWTMYCENISGQHAANSEQNQYCQSTLDDFWAKITPGVLRLVGHSKVMSDMVSTHFLQLIESLIESDSSILVRYLPMWNSVFYSYKRGNKTSSLAIRIQKCIEWQPPDLEAPDLERSGTRMINWLEKLQYKMSHIEIQSSQAAPFYLS